MATADECYMSPERNALLVLSGVVPQLLRGFFGTIVELSAVGALAGKAVYLVGDVAKIVSLRPQLEHAERVYVVRDCCVGYEGCSKWGATEIGVGRVPLLVHGVGILYPRFFEESDHFGRIANEHSFQTLTESTKPGVALRRGLYLTAVTRGEADELHFRLLRCSSNFSGPTESFGECDREILAELNREVADAFRRPAPLNHVLAQIYYNTAAEEGGGKDRKALIKAHSDKTKDMPRNGLMAFCTFYDGLEKLRPISEFDYGYSPKSGSALTTLRFRLKADGESGPTKQFDVTLYPNSVFMMPLSTNRLYTHEIRPSALNAALLPTRMGYVVRCSSTEAVHKDGRTFVKSGGELLELQGATPDEMAELRRLYAEENLSSGPVTYERVLFSMNRGDYMRPILSDGSFRVVTLPGEGGVFDRLLSTIQFEPVVGGRKGAVLVRPEARGIPIVRTTTAYAAPAQLFGEEHEELADRIRDEASLPLRFNNALAEVYDDAYATMGAHSDQALDLQAGSFIAVYSCYEHPDLASQPPRTLLVEPKARGGPMFEVPLLHNSAVVFSLDANSNYRHRIVLTTPGLAQNRWFGLTFRTSKTHVQFREGLAFLAAAPLALADDQQLQEFRKLKGRENREMGFAWPDLGYTASPSDTLPPIAS